MSWGLHDIGEVLAAKGETEKSVEVFEQALALKREIYGDEHLEVARTLNSLGLRMLEMQQIERGMGILERSLSMSERQLGPDHPTLAPSLHNLAEAHGILSDFETAERLQQRALALDERAFGDDHPNVALSLLNLASFSWESRRDCALTLERTRRAKAIFEQHYPADHPKPPESSWRPFKRIVAHVERLRTSPGPGQLSGPSGGALARPSAGGKRRRRWAARLSGLWYDPASLQQDRKPGGVRRPQTSAAWPRDDLRSREAVPREGHRANDRWATGRRPCRLRRAGGHGTRRRRSSRPGAPAWVPSSR